MKTIESISCEDQISLLYVDDEPELLNITKFYLEEKGEFRVDIISSGMEALDSANILSYDAIISDYHMPDMDGITFLKKVREKYGDIPFILFIGGSSEEILIEAINNGADFYLQKSGHAQFPIEELTYGIRQAVKKKRAEEALRESEEKFRSFVENANEILFSLAPDGTFTYVSPNWTELLGHDISDVIGRPSADFIHPDDYSRNRELHLQAIITGKNILGNEFRIKQKDGTWQWFIQSISPIHDAEGNITRVQGILHDITERRRSEEAIRKANRQLSLLSGITRHDILNRITVILGYLEVAETDITDPVMTEHFRRIKWATKEIQSQIEFTRVYEQLGSHEPRWVKLDTVMPRSSVPASISIKTDLEGIYIFADPMLFKVFFNLLDNSVRHGEQVTEIRVSASGSDNNMIIVWEDDGIGIVPEEKEKIFLRGFGKNTGLGMFLVREILSLTDITIHETGEPGKGTRFEILVPKGAFKKESAHKQSPILK